MKFLTAVGFLSFLSQIEGNHLLYLVVEVNPGFVVVVARCDASTLDMYVPVTTGVAKAFRG